MSQTLLDKVSILGLRSFDNNHGETMQFFTPLTIICGYNGSGKTTIIEALKFLTTGDQPPNSKMGGAFIHDPKLCGEKEVMALAKVGFRNTQGNYMICSRRLQLTVKKNTRQLKTLEAQLLLKANGERTAISSRVAELDQMMPMYLGVSKAILDNVIFCHQDESLWPLSEPANLKKRFDEIFEAMKYTKAIDNIKVIRKKYAVDLKTLQTNEAHAKDDKIKSEKVDKRMKQLEAEVERMRNQTNDISRKIEEAAQKNQEASDTAGSFMEIVSTIRAKRIEAETMDTNVKELKKYMKVMQDSDEELQSLHDSYQERVASFGKEIEENKQHYNDKASAIDEKRSDIGKAQTELGELQAQKKSYEQQVQNREESVKEAARRHGIRGFDQDLGDDQVKAFVDRIAKLAKDQRSAIEGAQTQTRKENQDIQMTLNSLNERKAALSRDKENARSSLTQNDRRTSELRRKINDIDVDEGQQSIHQTHVTETEAGLQAARSALEGNDVIDGISEIDSRIQSRDQALDQLNAELLQTSKHAEETARLDYLKNQISKTKQSLNTMKGAHSEKLSKLLESSWEPSNLNSLYERVIEEKTSELQAVEKQRDGTTREMEQISFQLKKTRDELKKQNKDLDAEARRVNEAISEDDPSNYNEVLNELETELNDRSGNTSSFTALKDYYQGVQKVLNERNKCKLCERAFKSESEKSVVQKKLEKNLAEAAKGLQEQDVATLKDDLEAVKSVKTSYDRWERLRGIDIPNLQSEVNRLEPKHNQLLQKIEEEDENVSEKNILKENVESIRKTVQSISKLVDDISQYETELSSLSQKQSQSGLSRGMQDVQSEIKQKNDEQRSDRAQLAQLQKKRDAGRDEVNRLEIGLRDARSHLADVVQQLKDKKSLQDQLEDLTRVNDEQRRNVRTIESDISSLAPQIAETQVKLDDASSRGQEKEKRLQDQLSNFSTTLNALELANREIKAYVESDGAAKLRQAQKNLNETKTALSKLEDEREKLVSHVNQLKEQGNKHDEIHRQIQDNLRYRDQLSKLDDVKNELRELDSHNAEDDREKWAREARKWQEERNRLSAEQAGLVGQTKTLDAELERLEQEWTTEYEGAPYRYREAHVKVEATKAAIEDLGRYGGALDKAIMRYHTLKMDEINEIIDDLWRRTYQGTDVDTILIRSDSEGPMRGGNKSYNYRVCMVKQDAEMDMRGRCSAGQKVLACIIIRLALAECFGTNCGVIALDEPTTNLDKPNIRALGQSLHAIIRARAAHQRNFQLIVITHDEDFLRDMRSDDFTDDYWRISRDAAQKTKIEKNSILDIFR